MKYAERRKYDYEFLIDLATAALGGKKKDDEISLDTGEGLDELSDEQQEAMRQMLGEDYGKFTKE